MAHGGTGDTSGEARRSVTRSDVAKLAGVSTAVVSYVVNDGPRPVAAATAKRVREAMDKLGYVPNASARALRRGKTETIGLVVGDSLNPFFVQYAFELVTAAADRGKQILIGDARQSEDVERGILEELIARQVDGLLFASPFANHNLAEVMGIPTVLIDCPGPIPGKLTVGSAAEAGAQEAVAHLVSHGRQRVGIIIGDHGFGNPDPRERGWRRALAEAGLPSGPLVTVPFSREGGYSAALALLRQEPRIDALFTSNDLQAIGALRALNERGVRVPEDIAVASFDGTMESEFSWPPLTVAKQQLDLLAAGAIDLLETPPSPAGRHVQVDTILVRRRSCGCDPEEIDHPRADVVVAPQRS
ncbi:MAG TPA: LacI family DNA-binding transcriptional regulator [Propionibacteriaceae bacterium]|nr:LacI family DNA-binding transcriptional regulator [Propionibacteriaceae bacterium]